MCLKNVNQRMFCSSPDVTAIEKKGRCQKVKVDNDWERHLSKDNMHFEMFSKMSTYQQLDVEGICHVPSSSRGTGNELVDDSINECVITSATWPRRECKGREGRRMQELRWSWENG